MKIALVNLNNSHNYSVLGGDGNAGLAAIADPLLREGHEVKLFPERGLHRKRNEVLIRLAKRVIDFGPDLIGESCMSEAYGRLIYFSRLIKSQKDIPIIGGGQHFHFDYYDEEKGIKNSVIDALLDVTIVESKERKTLDGVVVRGGQPFVEVVRNWGRKVDKSPRGLYISKNDRIYITGKGGFPEVSKAPYSLENTKRSSMLVWLGKGRRMSILANPNCPNDCCYCVNDTIKTDISPEMVISSILDVIGKVSCIDFVDPAGLIPPEYYERVFKAIKGAGVANPCSTYIDPSFLMLHRDKIYRMIQDYNIVGFFIGRETRYAEMAAAIGRNFLGKPRDQKRLDDERTEIFELLKFLGKIKRKFGVVISYIASPFDSSETITGNIEEMVEFKEKAPDNVIIDFHINNLKLYPGTGLREKYIDLVVNPNGFMNQDAYKWDPKQFPKYTEFEKEMRQLINKTLPRTREVLLEIKNKARAIL